MSTADVRGAVPAGPEREAAPTLLKIRDSDTGESVLDVVRVDEGFSFQMGPVKGVETMEWPDYISTIVSPEDAAKLAQFLATRERPAAAPAVSLNRETFHATFNGGWHDNPDALRAFHHGMDTVFNALESRPAAALSEAAILAFAKAYFHPDDL